MDTDKDGKPISFALGNITKPKRIDTVVTLNKQQYETLQKGVMAHGQDNRWIVFCRGSEYYFHRSWTGDRIFQASFTNLDGAGIFTDTFTCKFFFVETEEAKYKTPENDADVVKEFQKLLLAITSGQI